MRVLHLVLFASLLMPATAVGQDRQRVPPEADRSGGGTSSGNTGGTSTNTAAPREAAPAPAPPPAAAPAPAPSAPAPRSSSSSGDPGSGQAQPRQRVPPEARRDQPPPDRSRQGTAVPRPPNQPPPHPGDGHRGPAYGRPYYNNYYYYPRLYYPYGYGAFGLGYFYYDPYSWGMAYGYGPYPPFRGYGYGYPTGQLRLDVTPRTAEVYVDGYYAGVVDDFDGAFQSLELEEGTYHVEIVSPGYAPLGIDVRVFPGRKSTFQAALLPIRP